MRCACPTSSRVSSAPSAAIAALTSGRTSIGLGCRRGVGISIAGEKRPPAGVSWWALRPGPWGAWTLGKLKRLRAYSQTEARSVRFTTLPVLLRTGTANSCVTNDRTRLGAAIRGSDAECVGWVEFLRNQSLVAISATAIRDRLSEQSTKGRGATDRLPAMGFARAQPTLRAAKAVRPPQLAQELSA
ncbi:hypothetical protein AB7M17_006342 [Bradyrhizobium sp. USDA 377]